MFFLITLLSGGLDTGWTFYTPYSTETSTKVLPALTGVFILGFSSIFTGINFIVSIHTLRPPGMTWFKMPLFLWSIYATALIQVLATPVLTSAVTMVGVRKINRLRLSLSRLLLRNSWRNSNVTYTALL